MSWLGDTLIMFTSPNQDEFKHSNGACGTWRGIFLQSMNTCERYISSTYPAEYLSHMLRTHLQGLQAFFLNHTFHKFVILISSLRIKSTRPPDCIKCNQRRRRSLPRKSSIKRALAQISVHSCLFSVCEQWKQCYDNFYRWQISLSKCKTNTGWCFLLWISKMIAHIDKIYMWLIKICNPQFRQMKVK